MCCLVNNEGECSFGPCAPHTQLLVGCQRNTINPTGKDTWGIPQGSRALAVNVSLAETWWHTVRRFYTDFPLSPCRTLPSISSAFHGLMPLPHFLLLSHKTEDSPSIFPPPLSSLSAPWSQTRYAWRHRCILSSPRSHVFTTTPKDWARLGRREMFHWIPLKGTFLLCRLRWPTLSLPFSSQVFQMNLWLAITVHAGALLLLFDFERFLGSLCECLPYIWHFNISRPRCYPTLPVFFCLVLFSF